MDREFHFPEGFNADVVSLAGDGEVRIQREFPVRLQIGRPWPEHLPVEPDRETEVSISTRDLRDTVRILGSAVAAAEQKVERLS